MEEKFNKKWQDAIDCAEKVIQENGRGIAVQKERIHHLEHQISILEEQNQKLKDAGNMLAQKCEDLERICMAQQKALEEYQELFSELFPGKLTNAWQLQYTNGKRSMKINFEYVTNLQYEVKALRTKLKMYESGEAYRRQQETYEKRAEGKRLYHCVN